MIFTPIIAGLLSFSMYVHEVQEARPQHAPVWSWCGAHPSDPLAETITDSLSLVAEATFGPCIEPDWNTYSPANPGARYVDPVTYLALVKLNARHGMMTVVYDARVWSDDPATREAAIDFWWPWMNFIVAWDLGDEFDPDGPEWPILVHRWNTVLANVTPRTGIFPFTNHLAKAVGPALRDLPQAAEWLSFDQYAGDFGAGTAAMVDGQVKTLMCAVNTWPHGDFVVSDASIQLAIGVLDRSGCDAFLAFTGAKPYLTVPQPGVTSLVDEAGLPTSFLLTIKAVLS